MMHSNTVEGPFTHNDFRPSIATLEQARSWIGCRLVLRKPLLGFKPDLACIVMCVVDFGDGCLLWVSSDDNQAQDVAQLEVHRVLDYFQLPPTTQPGNTVGAPQ